MDWFTRRRALVSASFSRRRTFRPIPPQPPDHLARKYAMLYERAITPILALFAHNARDIQRRSDAVVPIFKNIEQLKIHYADLIEKALKSVSEALVSDVNADNKQKIDAVWRQVVGVPFTDTPELETKLAQHRKENVSLIKGLAGDALDRVHKAINETQGQHTHDVTKAVVEAIGVGQSRARLIARDQTLKINGNLTKERHESAGVTKYEWVTSSDERVRPMHRELNGMVFEWNKPPKVSKDNRHEHPGGDFQCRCTANPVIDLDEIEAKAAPTKEPELGAKPSWFNKSVYDLVGKEKDEFNKLHPAEQDAFSFKSRGKQIPADVVDELKQIGSKLFADLYKQPEFKQVVEQTPKKVQMTGPVYHGHAPKPVSPADASRMQVRRPHEKMKQHIYSSFDSMPINNRVEGIHYIEHKNKLQYAQNKVTGEYSEGAAVANKAVLSTMESKQVKALEVYTGSGYKSMNEYLRNGKDEFRKRNSKDSVERVENWIRDAHEGMSKLSRAPSDMVLFRGLRITDSRYFNQLDQLASSSEIEVPSFLSTSRDPKVGMGFAGNIGSDERAVIYRVHNHKSGVLMDGVTTVEGEAEVLFPPSTKFRVTGRQRVEQNVIIVDLEEV